MKKLYTASEYANYAHVHMYAFFSYLMSELSKEHMDTPESANIDVSIDGNIVKWQFRPHNPRAAKIISDQLAGETTLSQANIAKAVSELSAKLGKTAQIQNLELLTAEINKIAFTEARPEIPDDDSLMAPLVSFI